MSEHGTVTVLLARVLRTVFAASGLVGLLIAAVGVLGVVSYTVRRREREIAIRMAIGASGAQVRRMVVSQALRFVWVGLGVGLLLSLFVARALGVFLYAVPAVDVSTMAAVCALIGGIAVAASWLPAREVTTRAEVAEVLRES
jgi:ABC-type antimicrobial peptide transport system permease subunit